MKIEIVLSGEILKPMQRKKESFRRAVAMKNNHKGQLSKKACISLALELEGTQNLHTTSNCERLSLLGKFAVLVVQSVGLFPLVRTHEAEISKEVHRRVNVNGRAARPQHPYGWEMMTGFDFFLMESQLKAKWKSCGLVSGALALAHSPP